EVLDGAVLVERVRLRAVADVAGAAIEQRSAARDRHDRVPSSANPLVTAGHERQPVVSEMALAFRAAVRQAAGRRLVLAATPWPHGHRWAAAFSHDVDVIAAWPLFTALRGVELVRRGHLGGLVAVAGSAVRQIGRDPVWRGVQGVLEAERRAGVASTWFVLSGTPTMATFRRGDLTYRPESRRARAVIDAARGGAHEIGLHGSFATMADADALAAERVRLQRLTSHAPAGVRQHFLRMRPPTTQRAMVAAGFDYDATYGFPDRNGFRLGVADIIPAWDADAGTQLSLDEVPLVWMDRAQSKYQNIEDPGRWVDDALALAAASRGVEG